MSRPESSPIVLVPGALSGGWIWEDNFAQAFAEAGHPVFRPSFRGHGAPWWQRNTTSFEDYLDDCQQVFLEAAQDGPVHVVAHSLGGLLALHAAARVPVAAMVLLSPASPLGMRRSVQMLAQRSPLSLLKFAAAVCDARLTRLADPPVGIYSDTCCPRRSQAITSQLQSESLRVLSRLLRPPKLKGDALKPENILFIGAQGDHIIPATEVERAAAALGSPAHIYPGLSHTYQAENAWPQIAAHALDWLHWRARPGSMAEAVAGAG